jgi:hypothetical protein
MSGCRALKPSIQRSPIGRKGGGVFESCKPPRLISSTLSVAKAGDAGKPVLVKRVSHRTNRLLGVRENLFGFVSLRA